MMACRVAWQHDLTPEQALEVARRDMEPQMDRALRSYAQGGDADLGAGPMRPVRPGEADRYVEIVSTDHPEADPIASFLLPKDSKPTPELPPGWRKWPGR